MMKYENEIGSTLNKTLKEKVVLHRDRFSQIFKARYLEMLPSLIHYKNGQSVNVDWMKVEIALRNGYDIVIGETRSPDEYKRIQVIGYAKSKLSHDNPADLFSYSDNRLRHADIHFLIPEQLRKRHYKEISYADNCKLGNFVVLRNKNVNRVSDYQILEHYTDELAEIVLSRYSISMQVKISTLFLGNPNDQTVLDIISDIYNGNPYIPASKLFDPEEQIFQIDNHGVAQNFAELKREYQNKISELNNMLGVQSLAVEKESGVSDEEAKSNRGYTTSNANIHLDGRNHGLLKLNKRYDLQLEAQYNDEVASEFAEIIKEEGDEKNGDQSV